VTRKLGFGGEHPKKAAKSVYPPPNKTATVEINDADFDEEFNPGMLSLTLSYYVAHEALVVDELSESFCLVPSGPEPAAALKQENTKLKAEMNALQQRLLNAERVLQIRQEQDQQLKDSIVLARREVSLLPFFLDNILTSFQ
jgi:hypothetical protein